MFLCLAWISIVHTYINSQMQRHIVCILGKKKYWLLQTAMTGPVFTVHISPVPLPHGYCCLHLASFTHEWRQLGCITLVADILQEIESTFWSKRPEMSERPRQKGLQCAPRMKSKANEESRAQAASKTAFFFFFFWVFCKVW